jgi:hypothetical protein
MKKITLIFSLILIIFFLFTIASQGQAQITFTNPLTPGNIDFDQMLTRVLSWVFGFALVIGVLMVIIGGYMMVGSSGDPLKFATGRKTVIYALAGVAIITASRGIIALVGLVLPQGVDAGTAIYNIIVYAFGFLIVISVLMLIVAGFLFATGGGNPEQVTKAKRWLIYALIGLAVGLFSRGLVAIVISVIWP